MWRDYLVASANGREVCRQSQSNSLKTHSGHPNKKGTHLNTDCGQHITQSYLASIQSNQNGSPKSESGMFPNFLLHEFIVFMPLSYQNGE